MSLTVIWFILTLVFIIAEMLVGSLYLFALSMGCLFAGIFAYFDFSADTQAIIAGIVTILGAIGFYFLKRKRKKQDSDDNFDIGQSVHVTEIKEDGSATVMHRGARWQAKAKTGNLSEGYWTISEIKGIYLILEQK